MKSVVYQSWLETERGWGQRPDGFTLHRNEEEHQEFVRNYWSEMPTPTPEEYSRPDGDPVAIWIPDDVHARLITGLMGKHGMWFSNNWDPEYVVSYLIKDARISLKDEAENIEHERKTT